MVSVSIRRFALFVALAFLVAPGLWAAPDCSLLYKWSNRPIDQSDGVTTFTTNGSTAVPAPAYNNKSTGCTGWIMIVDVEGFSADSVELDSAAQGAPNSPGTFVTFAGSTVS